MFNFNPQLTIRNLFNNRFVTFVNAGGFLLGLTSIFYLYFYIQSELNHDSFHTDQQNIYRLLRVGNIKASDYFIGVTSGPFASAIKTDFPQDVNSTCRAMLEEGLVTFGAKSFYEKKLLFADPNFFTFFSFPLKHGDPSTVLNNANSCILSVEMAIKYFGGDDPIGKIISVDNQYDFIVTGVMDEFPDNSHLDFDIVFPIAIFNKYDWFNNWWNNGLITYLNIDTPIKAQKINEQLPAFMDKYFAEDFKSSGSRVDLILEPLNDIYFNNDTRYDPVKHGNLRTVFILIAVAVAILIIACFNYMNLSIAQTFARSKEVGIRKILGGGIGRLTLQFLSEVFLILAITTLLSILVLELMLPLLNGYFGLEVELHWGDLNVIMFLSLLFLIILLLSGLYPTLHLAFLQPLKSLKGLTPTNSNSFVKKGIVTVQYMISVFMVSATILVATQLDFLNSMALGFDDTAIITIDINNQEVRENLDAFRVHLQSNPHIQSITYASGEPGGFHDTSSFKIEDVEESIRFRTLFTDRHYLQTLGVTLADGQNFRELAEKSNNGGMLLNETAVKELGIDGHQLIGRKISMPGWDIERTIVGIVKDYHFLSLHTNIEPLAIIQGGRPRKIVLKLNTDQLNQDIEFVNQAWAVVSPSFPISYDFLDDSLNALYENEQKQSHVFNVFALISIFLACLGVVALTSYSTQKRQAEYGMRKLLGATVSHIVRLISVEFMIIIALSALLAVPFTVLFMSNWLSGFAYRIDLLDYWPVYLLSGLLLGLITWVTVGILTYKSAISNPLESIQRD
jgi:putative ABC transport system permease protein